MACSPFGADNLRSREAGTRTALGKYITDPLPACELNSTVSPGQTGDIMTIPAQTRSPGHFGPLWALMWRQRGEGLPVGEVLTAARPTRANLT